MKRGERGAFIIVYLPPASIDIVDSQRVAPRSTDDDAASSGKEDVGHRNRRRYEKAYIMV